MNSVAISVDETTAESTVQVGSVAFAGAWLHDVADPAGTVRQFRYDGRGRDEEWRPEAVLLQFAGRSYPVVEFGQQTEERLGAEGRRSPVVKTVLLIPTRDNDGRPFPRSAWRELEQQLLALAGGFSRQDGFAGAWSDGSRVYRDVSRQYIVSLASWTQFPAWLDIVRWARDRFRQEAIYIEVAGVPEIIGGGIDPRSQP